MTDRRVFLRGVAVAALAAPCVAEAQRPPTIRRIGLLAPIAERTIGAPFFQQLLGTWISFAEEGVLMAYSPSLADQFRRAAVYVDKILRGAKPADLPVEQPTKFELVINMKTAKALGLALPQSLLLRADQVID